MPLSSQDIAPAVHSLTSAVMPPMKGAAPTYQVSFDLGPGLDSLCPVRPVAIRTGVRYGRLVQLLRRWSNGRFGWGRRVVKIYLVEQAYVVEAVQGSGDNAQVRQWLPPTEEEALQTADELMSDADQRWREVTDT